jgi:hypothetical protein
MEEDWKPKVDMIFNSLDDAWNFWNDYGGRVGFSARSQYAHKNDGGSVTCCNVKSKSFCFRSCVLGIMLFCRGFPMGLLRISSYFSASTLVVI